MNQSKVEGEGMRDVKVSMSENDMEEIVELCKSGYAMARAWDNVLGNGAYHKFLTEGCGFSHEAALEKIGSDLKPN